MDLHIMSSILICIGSKIIYFLICEAKQFFPHAEIQIKHELDILKTSIYVPGKSFFFPRPKDSNKKRMNWGKGKSMHTELWENDYR